MDQISRVNLWYTVFERSEWLLKFSTKKNAQNQHSVGNELILFTGLCPGLAAMGGADRNIYLPYCF